MSDLVPLDRSLAAWAGDDALRRDVAATINALAAACCKVADVVADGALAGDLAASAGDGIAGDVQKELDVRANNLLVEALAQAPVAAMASEELDLPIFLKDGAPILVAVDPLDGSSNIDTNVSVGTIFSLMRNPADGPVTERSFFQHGRDQLAAGYVIYGPQVALVLTVGDGTDIYTVDHRHGTFMRTHKGVQVAPKTREFAINASNYRHWDDSVRAWFDDCLAGSDGCRQHDFNMRWIASMVAEAHRILMRGGIYVYPGDARAGYGNGRLRLLYEANPIGMIMEQAGGAVSTGRVAILDLLPRDLHQRVPLIFGSRDEVERVTHYHEDPHSIGGRSPLFARRGLFRS